MKKLNTIIFLVIAIVIVSACFFISDIKSLLIYKSLRKNSTVEIYNALRNKTEFPKQVWSRDLTKKELLIIFENTNDPLLRNGILFDLSKSFRVSKKDLLLVKAEINDVFNEIMYYFLYLTYYEEKAVLNNFIKFLETKQSENCTNIEEIEDSITSFFGLKIIHKNKFYIPLFEQLICSSNSEFRGECVKILYDLKGKREMEEDYTDLILLMKGKTNSSNREDILNRNKLKGYYSLKDNDIYDLSVEWQEGDKILQEK